MASLTLTEIEPAVRRSWSVETCDPVDVLDWSPANRARGQCGVTALVVQDLLGGVLLCAEVHGLDGVRQGVHYWNRLPAGADVDLTREQFRAGELISEPEVVVRPAGLPRRCREQYLLLRQRVAAALGGAASRGAAPPRR